MSSAAEQLLKQTKSRDRSHLYWTWQVQRTLFFWAVGLLNTVMIRPEDVGSWKNWIGRVLITLAILDSIVLLYRAIQALRSPNRRETS